MERDLEVIARRAYELHRAKDAKRGRREGPSLTWDQLDEGERARWRGTMRRCHEQYDAGRGAPTISPIVSDPPALSAAEIERIRQESDELGAAYLKRTASMERLTVEDLRTRCR